jgi:hypothetical protein
MGTLSPIESKAAHMHQNPSNFGRLCKPPLPRQYTKIKQCRDKTSAKKCWEHIILCPRCGHDSPHGPQLHWDGTHKSHRSDIGEVHTIAELSGKQQPSDGKISHVGYDNEHTFQCIVTFSSGSTEPYMQAFFSWDRFLKTTNP